MDQYENIVFFYNFDLGLKNEIKANNTYKYYCKHC